MSATRKALEPPQRRTGIFIVEDEALISMELQDRLKTLEYTISGTASRGEDAVEAILASSPDLVLMDVRLAGSMSGIDTAHRLRHRSDVPVIFLSAYSDAELLSQAGAVEPFGYLVKPFEERELHASIQMALYRYRMERALRDAYAQLEERVKERTGELARSREDLAVLLDSIGDAVLATDASGRITRLNRVAQQLTCWSEADAMGRPVAEVFRIINEETREPAVIPVDEVLATGERQTLANHTFLISRDGGEVSIADSAAPIRDAAGHIVGAVLVFRDETQARERRLLLARQGNMLGALRSVQEEFINSPSSAPPYGEVLSVLLQATDSDLGFVGEVQSGPDGKGSLDIRAARGDFWQEVVRSANVRIESQADSRSVAASLSQAVDSGMPTITSAVVDTTSVGGAALLRSVLSIPILVTGRVVGIIGVSNRSGYGEDVLGEIQPLLATYRSLIEGRRGAERRRSAEESLRELNANLEAEVERRTAERRRVEEALRVVSTELGALAGEEFYAQLVRRLADLLQIDFAVLARTKFEMPGFMETLSVWGPGGVESNFSYGMTGSGWAGLADQQPLMVENGAQQRFSGDVFIAKNGIAALAAVPLFDGNGATCGQLVVLHRQPLANSARVQAILKIFGISASAEIERQRSARRFHDLFEFSPDAIVMTDRLGLITVVNRKAETMFGRSRAELAGESIELLMPGQKAAWLKLPRDRAGAGGGSAGRLDLPNLSARRRDGREFPVEISLGLIDTGEGVMIAAAVRDITDRLHAERQANRAQRLESIGTLAGGIAHDLNNTLTPILLGLDALKSQFPGEPEILETIERSANHAAEMVRQLLGFAKGTEGRRSSLQPLELLEDMQKIIKSTFPKNIAIRLRAAKDLTSVRVDATQLHQVLLNLCVNARDAMPNGGTLTLEAESISSIEVESVPPGNAGDPPPPRYVVLRVSDNGSGIEPEALERIFDPFYTTKGPESGTGLGLFTAAGIVKGHGGFIRVQSQPAVGSTFAVYLPAETQAVLPPALEPSSSAVFGKGETILYVDDETAVREVARTVLERLNFKPLIADDGMTGLIQAVENRATLRAVITDLHMPHMDGLSFVRALRRAMPEVAIIVASGRLEAPSEQELKKLGVQVVLEKPFTQEMLGMALQRVFSATRVNGVASA